LKPFADNQQQISIENGIILWGYKIIIPVTLRKRILNVLHTAHAGVVKTKSVARSHIWWPSLDIESFVKACKPCARAKSCSNKAELIPWTLPEKAWSCVHVDFEGPIIRVYIFILVDAYSKWVEVFIRKQLTA
jgi:hypothetical protein